MKILQVAPPWVDIPPEDYGGTEWVVANLVKGLSNLGHDVILFATKSSKVEGRRYVFQKPLFDQRISWSAALPALIHYHEAFKHASDYDVVHTHLSSETDLAMMPFLADLTQKNIPNIVTVHSRWPFDDYSHMDQIFLDLYANKITAVNISHSMQEVLPKQFRDGGVVYNSLDVSKIKFNPKVGQYLTWLGKIVPEKGTAQAIKVAKKMGEQLIFAGVIDQQRKDSVDYFRFQVKPLIDDRQIKYLGPADLKLKNELLGGAKAFLNPIAWDEPFGLVIIESMASGTPVISFSRGAAPEVIKDKETGFLVNSTKGMLKAISQIPSISRIRCREHVIQYFGIESAAKQYLDIYNKEIRRHNRVTRSKIISGNGMLPKHNGKRITSTALSHSLFGQYNPSGSVRSRSSIVYIGIERKS